MSTKEEALLRKVRQGEIPRHIAIIMDGNGRWAKKRGMPRIYGHRAGAQSVREAIQTCGDLGVEVLTLYAFSTENWTRPRVEVDALMELLCTMLRKEAESLNRHNVRLRTIGRTDQLPARVRKELAAAIEKLSNNTGLILNLALNYGGRQEIVDAVNRLLAEGAASVDEKTFAEYLYTAGLRDPDLLIRTSGEQRISNFLPYQIAYSEFYITKTLWPDFRRADFFEAILDYQQRERRFGATTEQLSKSGKLEAVR